MGRNAWIAVVALASVCCVRGVSASPQETTVAATGQAAILLETQFPERFGDWKVDRDLAVDRRELARAGAVGTISRVYRNTRTGAKVSVFMVCATPADAAGHTPDRCFPDAGFEIHEPEHRETIAIGDGRDAEVFTGAFKRGDMTLRTVWTYGIPDKQPRAAGDAPGAADAPQPLAWVAPQHARNALHEFPTVYKLYVIIDESRGGGPRTAAACAGFIARLVPAFDEALAEGRAVLAEFAGDAPAMLARARQLRAEGKQRQAATLLEWCVRLRPDDTEAAAEHARLMLKLAVEDGASSAAILRAYNAMEKAVRCNPDDDDLRLELAEFQLRVGRFSDAREHLETLRSRAGGAGAAGDAAGAGIDPVKTQLLLARALAGAGEFDSAARLAGELIGYDVPQRVFDADRRRADVTEAYVLLATILEERLDDAAAAAGVFAELGRQRDGDVAACLALAQWHRRHGELDAAARDIQRAAAVAPDNPDVVWTTFELAIARSDFAAAEAVAIRARELFPVDERVSRGLAAIALQRNDPAAAEAALRDGLARKPDAAALLLMLTDTLLLQGKIDDADGILARFEDDFGTTNPVVGLLHSRVLMARGRWQEARKRLEEIRPLARGNAAIIRQIDLCLGTCRKNLEEVDE